MTWQVREFFCLPEMTDDPAEVNKGNDVLHETFPDVFGACAQSRKFEETVDLSESVNVSLSDYTPESDDLKMESASFLTARLLNSETLRSLRTLKDLSTKLSHLPVSDQADLRGLISKYPTLFNAFPSTTHVIEHIDVGSHIPVKQNAYRVNPIKRDLMKHETQNLLEHGLAVPSSSPWCSPCLLVPKSDGTSRFCTDYWKVNALMKPDSFPLPCVQDCVDRVGNSKFVTKLDLLKGYWQVPLTERASEVSAFATPDAFLQYRVMAFGLRNAGATFQHLMSRVLLNVPNCDAYLDDVVCYFDSWDEHIQLLNCVFACLKEANLTLNLAKCEFACATVSYLGKEVGNCKVRPLGSKIQVILDFPVPMTKRELRRFLGMTGYYRNFCLNFSGVANPLTGLLRKRGFFRMDFCMPVCL